MTDIEELIQHCKSGNREAQKILYNKFSRLVMGICYRYSRSRPDAEDIFQEVFVKIFTNLHQYSGNGSFEGWIRRIAVNTSIKYVQRDTFRVSVEIDPEDDNLVDFSSAVEKLSANELLDLINELPEGYRLVFNLYAIEGYTHKEIGEMLSISEGTSKSQFFHAKKVLQTVLKAKGIMNIEERLA
ncbi:MAG: RNA polymerase sigma factor [Cytophagaceae bacterium]